MSIIGNFLHPRLQIRASEQHLMKATVRYNSVMGGLDILQLGLTQSERRRETVTLVLR